MLTKSAEDLFTFGEDHLTALAADVGTPCFVYDLGAARERWDRLRQALPGRVRLAYAVKSNPGGPLLETFAAQGAWFDCASAGEVSAVLAAGGTGRGMVFAGPAKSARDLQAAVYAGARVQVDGIEDVQRLHALHTKSGTEPLAVSVRVHPASGISESSAIIGGVGPSAFGVDEEDLVDFLAAARAYDRVRITGLQVFSASNELDPGVLLANHRTALRIARFMHVEHAVKLELIDLGGGLGIRYAAHEPSLDIHTLGAGLERLLAEHDWFTGELLLEPGRWLSGPCGVYLTRVVRVKQSRGTRFALLEGGINHLLRPLLTGQSFPVTAPGRGGEHTTYTLAGPLCTSLDRVGTAELPVDLAPGDVLAFGQVGAYAATQAMTHFLSHPAPGQHWIR